VRFEWSRSIAESVRRYGRPWSRSHRRLAVCHRTLLGWVKRTELDAGSRPGTTTAEAQRIKALERENKELRRANDILRTASAFFAQAELDRKLKS
jgi:transposase-like protein